MVCNFVQCVSVRDFFNRNLFEPLTNYMCSKVILNFVLYTKGYSKVTSR